MNADDCSRIATSSAPPGRPFMNRVLFRGRLTAASPLHVGNGRELDQSEGPRRMVVDAAVETDWRGRPVIPGSAIRGALRAELARGLPHGEELAGALLGRLERGEDAAAVGRASKADFFDAPRVTEVPDTPLLSAAAPPHWDPGRGTFVMHSVSLTEDGVAKEHHLFSVEVVPQGTAFAVEVWGRNMADEEIALLQWLFERFNDPVAPLTLGAHAGRGFGRLEWAGEPPRVWGRRRRLSDAAPLAEGAGGEWFDGSAGSLRDLLRARADTAISDEDLASLSALSESFSSLAREQVGAASVAIDIELELLSDLLVRGYPSEDAQDDARFRLNTGAAKYRGREGQTSLTMPAGQAPPGENAQVGSLAFGVRLDAGGSPRAVFEVPGSSLRGAMRAVCDRYAGAVSGSLFGSMESKGRISFDAFSLDGPDEPVAALYEGMTLGGAAADGAPFVLKNRTPHDRMVGGVKHGGLHTFLAVRRAARLRGRVRIDAATAEDLAAVALWRDRLNSGVARLGGASAEGDGRVAVTVTAVRSSGARPPELPEPDASLATEASGLGGWAAVVPARPEGHAPTLRESQEPYAMNPYDFVAFPRRTLGGQVYVGPTLRSPAEWEFPDVEEDLGLLSGRVSVRCDVLQPVFIAGRWAGGVHDGHWQFHRSGMGAAIPGASIRGMLRSYVEAAWNGWVSVYSRNDRASGPYAKVFGERYCGFDADGPWSDPSGADGRGPRKPSVPQSLPEPFVPRAHKAAEEGVDLASFLFGIVLEPEHEGADGYSLRSRVLVGDGVVRDDQLATVFWYPDVAGDALLGGAKPVKSTMLYFDMDGATVKRRTTANHPIAQFTAGPFRGRKFYFHQDWRRCVTSYDDHTGADNYWARGQKPGVTVHRAVQALKPGESVTFDVWFDRLPPCALDLLLEALSPSSGVAHKLGGLKPFGYGSVRMTPTALQLYSARGGRLVRLAGEDEALFHDRPQSDADYWAWACDRGAYRWSDRYLRYVLTYPHQPETAPIFCYPAYGQGARGALERGFAVPNRAGVLDVDGAPRPATIEDVAAFFDLPPGDAGRKITLHLGLLQRGSRKFPSVLHRALRPGEDWEELALLVHRDAIP